VALLFFALLDVVYAIALAAADATTRATPMYRFLETLIPLGAWSVVWGGVGVLCLFQAFVRSDRVAFSAAAALKGGFGLVILAGWIWADVPRGYVTAVIWLAFAGFVQVISTWPEPEGIRGER
jgi:hypothetical protein